MKFQPFSEDMLDSWVMFKDSQRLIQDHLEELGMADASFNGGLGYVYADHSAGISLNVEYLLALGPKDQLLKKVSFLETTQSRLMFRADACSEMAFHPISAAGLAELQLPAEPDWLHLYDSHPDWRWMRKEKSLAPFRAPNYPYDLQFDIGGEEYRTEGVWGRFLQRIPQENLVLALELLVEPHQDFGIHQGDILPVLFYPREESDDEDKLIWLKRFGTLERA